MKHVHKGKKSKTQWTSKENTDKAGQKENHEENLRKHGATDLRDQDKSHEEHNDPTKTKGDEFYSCKRPAEQRWS